MQRQNTSSRGKPIRETFRDDILEKQVHLFGQTIIPTGQKGITAGIKLPPTGWGHATYGGEVFPVCGWLHTPGKYILPTGKRKMTTGKTTLPTGKNILQKVGGVLPERGVFAPASSRIFPEDFP